jgi:ubiquinone/menaquinone biosynthesis C-methylase UbiE
MNIDQKNAKVYGDMRVVHKYAQTPNLQPPEQSILNILGPQLKGMRMLDIGVGAGRTTAHFAALVQNYTGIDYSQGMIQFCQEKYKAYTFKHMDVRSMESFEDARFDFVLFSYNGIDYMEYQDRQKILREIKRIISSRGCFCFSTHNFDYLPNYCNRPLSLNPFALWPMWQRHSHIKALLRHPSVWHTVLRDGGENFRLHTFYIKPTEQVNELEKLGFTNIRLFSESGQEIHAKGVNSLDRWIYYLCSTE